MPLTLGPGATGDKFAAKQDAGTDVIYEISGDLRTISGPSDAYGSLAQGALSSTPTALLGPAADTDMLVSNINVINTGASTRVVTFYKTRNSTTYDATTIWATITLLAGERAGWDAMGWQTYNAQGVVKSISTFAGMVISNAALSAVTGFAADTYLAGSALALPTGLVRAGTKFKWIFDAVKTAAGTAAVTIIIRWGTGGVIGDTARVTFTFSIQTAAVDRAIFEVWATLNSYGATGVMAGVAKLHHQLAVTGFNTVQPAGLQTLYVASAGFDMTVANSIVGLSFNGGTSDVVTISLVHAEAFM
jgi:hypothetical protein